MSSKYSDLYKEKVKSAIPITTDEQNLFHLMMQEKRNNELAEEIANIIDKRQHRRVGAPRKTQGDIEQIKQLMAAQEGELKLVRQKFIKAVCERDHIEKKQARHRFKTAMSILEGKA
jgi:hypothetical protein